MFQDEARFGRINSPHNCWAPPGVRPSVPCHMVREYTYAYAAVSPADGVLDSLVLPVVNAHAMSLFLSEVSQRHPNDFILMVMDKAGWHQAKDLKVPKNMRIIFLPPYSPELNPESTSGRRSVKSGFQTRSSRAWMRSKVSSSMLSNRTIPGKGSKHNGIRLDQ